MRDHIDRLEFAGKIFVAFDAAEVRETLRVVLERCHELAWREEGDEEVRREHQVLVGVYGKTYAQAKKATEGRGENRYTGYPVVRRKAGESDEEREKRAQRGLSSRGFLFEKGNGADVSQDPSRGRKIEMEDHWRFGND